MKLLKKYGLFLLFCLFWGFTAFYLEPRQERSYFAPDVQRFSRTISLVLFLVEGGLLCLLLIVNKFSLRQALSGLVVVLPVMLCLFWGFRDGLSATGLYVNKFKIRQKFERAYIAQYLNGDRSATSFSLYDIESRKTLIDGEFVKAAYRSGPSHGDTLRAHLNRGLFNVVYFDDTAVWKR